MDPAQFEFVDVNEELVCAVCLDPFSDPVELKPCGDVFCRQCCSSLRSCPKCRASIQSRGDPNRIVKNMAAEAPVMCKRCGWKGTRSNKASHTQCGQHAGPASAMSTSPPPLGGVNAAGALLPPQQQQQPMYTQQPQAQPWWWQQQQMPAADTRWAPQQPPAGPASGYYTAPQQPVPMGQYVPPAYGSYYPPPAPHAQPPAHGGYNPNGAPRPPPANRLPVIDSSRHHAPWELFGLSQIEYDQLVSIFIMFDEDDSGSLDREELTRLARCLNFAQQPGDIDRMFRDMDQDGNGTLSRDEFCTWLKYNKPDPQALYGLPQAEYNCVMMQFRQYDSNHDGSLSLPEFQRLCQAMKYYPSAQQAADVFRMIDLDRSGSIDLNEFLLFRARGARQQ